MERANLLVLSPSYRENLARTAEKEANRFFCRHDHYHGLDVARLCWIFLLEEKIEYSRDVVYSVALLHDIGRWMEYEGKGCHALLSSRLADPILLEAGFTREERRLITTAIAEHRLEEYENFSSPLSFYLRKADKYSRQCYQCPAGKECYKIEEMPHVRELQY